MRIQLGSTLEASRTRSCPFHALRGLKGSRLEVDAYESSSDRWWYRWTDSCLPTYGALQ